MAECGSAKLNGHAAKRIAFVRRTIRIDGFDSNTVEPDIQFVGNNLCECRLYALAEFGTTGQHVDHAVGSDVQPRIDQRVLPQHGRQRLRILRDALKRRDAEADGDARSAGEELAPIKHRLSRPLQRLPPAGLRARCDCGCRNDTDGCPARE